MPNLHLVLFLALSACRAPTWTDAQAAGGGGKQCAVFATPSATMCYQDRLEKGTPAKCEEPVGLRIVELPPGWEPLSGAGTGVLACK